MKRSIYLLTLLSLMIMSCQVDDIKTYDINNCAVVFKTKSLQFSMKGVTEEFATRTLTMDLIGPLADYDRKIDLRVLSDADNTATENVDFTVGEAVMKAGEHVANVDFNIHKLPEGVENQKVTLEIVPNEYFIKGYPENSKVVVMWSEEYVRPTVLNVWREWFFFLCKGYSKNYHKVLVDVFGTDIEVSTRSLTDVRNDETLVYRANDWWYGANDRLFDYVKTYDAEHPDAPLMHSDDYEVYRNYTDAVGTGTKPQRIPTIYETLNQL